VNAVIVMEIFLLTKNLLVLSIGLPIHGLCMLVCAREPRWFELASLWAQTRLPALAGTLRYWRASSYSPLRIDLPNAKGRRRNAPTLVL
jgi:type IV secretion system protein VirB3